MCLKKNHMAILYFSHKNATYLNKQERKEKKTLSEYFSVNQEKIWRKKQMNTVIHSFSQAIQRTSLV